MCRRFCCQLTTREAAPVSDILMSTDENRELEENIDNNCVIEGEVNTTHNWYGFFANLTLAGDGGFHFVFTYPYDMQIQSVLLYDRDDLRNLRGEQSCWQKLAVVPSSQISEKVLDLSYR